MVNHNLVTVGTADTSWDYDSEHYRVVGIYGDLQGAGNSLMMNKSDIVVIMIPEQVDESFVDDLKEIRFHNATLKILLITDRYDPPFIFDIVSVGLCGILPSNTLWPEIIKHLERIESGLAPLPPQVAKIILDSFRVNLVPNLTRRQIEIIKLMFQGMTYLTISNHLSISKETTKTHMRNIYRRLNVNSKEEAMSKAIAERIIIFNS